jgi:uncharacterized CHY-type Zn-finger protein
MNLLQRIKKIEEKSISKTSCFCGKTLIDLWYGKESVLMHCPKCKDKFDKWAEITAEAQILNNLTDGKGANEFDK